MGPWSRSFVSAVVGRTERPSDEAIGAVHDLTVAVGVIRARVGDCTVTLSSDPVPPRIWAAMTRFARGRGPLEEAVAGRIQSVHLEHLLAEDWGEPLVPRARSITQACTCDPTGRCDHLVALAYAIADAADLDPATILAWRGCVEGAPPVGTDSIAAVDAPAAPSDPWKGGDPPDTIDARVLPVGAVLQRLGPVEIRVGDEDLSDVVRRAYRHFAASKAR